MAIDPEIKAIEDALNTQGRPKAELGRLLGLDSSQITRIFKGQRRLQRHEHQAVLEYLGMASPPAHAVGGSVVGMPGLVPLYGWVGAASDSRITFAEQNLRGFVPMHPNQAHVREPFALEVSDISMSPRYEPGEIVYVAPNRWPSRGQDCVLVTTDDAGFLKRFMRRDATGVTLYQLNPERELPFRLEDVASMHTVVGRG